MQAAKVLTSSGMKCCTIPPFKSSMIICTQKSFSPAPIIAEEPAICFWNKCYDNTKDLVKVTTHEGNGNINVANRNLIYKDLDIFVRNSKAIDILNKVVDSGEVALSTYISAAKAFGFRTFFISDPLFRPDPSGLNTPVKCYGRSGRIGYVEKAEIPSHTEWIDRWKVYVPESNNIGTELNDDNQNAFVGEPNSICTETFLVVGADLGLSEESAANLVGYLKTKFARFLLSLAKISQHGTTRTYRFVPAQDFETLWTDAKLYQKYALSVDEIAVIESSIKPME